VDKKGIGHYALWVGQNSILFHKKLLVLSGLVSEIFATMMLIAVNSVNYPGLKPEELRMGIKDRVLAGNQKTELYGLMFEI
jgi:hypothetical protein